MAAATLRAGEIIAEVFVDDASRPVSVSKNVSYTDIPTAGINAQPVVDNFLTQTVTGPYVRYVTTSSNYLQNLAVLRAVFREFTNGLQWLNCVETASNPLKVTFFDEVNVGGEGQSGGRGALPERNRIRQSLFGIGDAYKRDVALPSLSLFGTVDDSGAEIRDGEIVFLRQASDIMPLPLSDVTQPVVFFNYDDLAENLDAPAMRRVQDALRYYMQSSATSGATASLQQAYDDVMSQVRHLFRNLQPEWRATLWSYPRLSPSGENVFDPKPLFLAVRVSNGTTRTASQIYSDWFETFSALDFEQADETDARVRQFLAQNELVPSSSASSPSFPPSSSSSAVRTFRSAAETAAYVASAGGTSQVFVVSWPQGAIDEIAQTEGRASPHIVRAISQRFLRAFNRSQPGQAAEFRTERTSGELSRRHVQFMHFVAPALFQLQITPHMPFPIAVLNDDTNEESVRCAAPSAALDAAEAEKNMLERTLFYKVLTQQVRGKTLMQWARTQPTLASWRATLFQIGWTLCSINVLGMSLGNVRAESIVVDDIVAQNKPSQILYRIADDAAFLVPTRNAFVFFTEWQGVTGLPYTVADSNDVRQLSAMPLAYRSALFMRSDEPATAGGRRRREGAGEGVAEGEEARDALAKKARALSVLANALNPMFPRGNFQFNRGIKIALASLYADLQPILQRNASELQSVVAFFTSMQSSIDNRVLPTFFMSDLFRPLYVRPSAVKSLETAVDNASIQVFYLPRYLRVKILPQFLREENLPRATLRALPPPPQQTVTLAPSFVQVEQQQYGEGEGEEIGGEGGRGTQRGEERRWISVDDILQQQQFIPSQFPQFFDVGTTADAVARADRIQ